MNYKELQKKASEAIKKYPTLEVVIIDMLKLCYYEIDEGGSVEHECELAWTAIQNKINEHKQIRNHHTDGSV